MSLENGFFYELGTFLTSISEKQTIFPMEQPYFWKLNDRSSFLHIFSLFQCVPNICKL